LPTKRGCVVYTGTHDTNTCQGWFEKTDNQEDKELFFRYVSREIREEVNWEFIRMALASVAKTAIVPLQDILGLGEDAGLETHCMRLSAAAL
jgi:4-alpha-glucanotransferase